MQRGVETERLLQDEIKALNIMVDDLVRTRDDLKNLLESEQDALHEAEESLEAEKLRHNEVEDKLRLQMEQMRETLLERSRVQLDALRTGSLKAMEEQVGKIRTEAEVVLKEEMKHAEKVLNDERMRGDRAIVKEREVLAELKEEMRHAEKVLNDEKMRGERAIVKEREVLAEERKSAEKKIAEETKKGEKAVEKEQDKMRKLIKALADKEKREMTAVRSSNNVSKVKEAMSSSSTKSTKKGKGNKEGTNNGHKEKIVSGGIPSRSNKPKPTKGARMRGSPNQ